VVMDVNVYKLKSQTVILLGFSTLTQNSFTINFLHGKVKENYLIFNAFVR